jgi:hypothetical protein
MLITWALWSTAQRIPLAMSRAVPNPSASSTRIGMIFARGARPVSATLLPVRSAIVPAMWVPCPSRSSGILLRSTTS